MWEKNCKTCLLKKTKYVDIHHINHATKGKHLQVTIYVPENSDQLEIASNKYMIQNVVAAY